MQDPRDRLLLTARLRAALGALLRQQALPSDDAAALARQLDAVDGAILQEFDATDLPDLLLQCEEAGLAIDFPLIRGGLRAARLHRLDGLRKAAQTRGFLSDFSKEIPLVELRDFDWQALTQQWIELAGAVLDPGVTLDALTAQATQFYSPDQHDAALPVRFEPGLRRLIPRLIKIRALDPDSAPARIEELRLARDALKDAIAAAHLELGMDGQLQGSGEAQFRALETFTGLNDATIDIAPALAAWRGPFFTELADRWLRIHTDGPDESTARAAELLYARTGVDAYSNRAEWDALVETVKVDEHERLLTLRAAGATDAAIAGLTFMLSQRATSRETIQTHWWPLVEGLRDYHAPPEQPTPAPAPAAVAEALGAVDVAGIAATASAITAPPAATRSPQITDTERAASASDAFEYVPSTRANAEANDRDIVLPEDDAEFISAPEHTPHQDDAIVESKSAWSVYLRPFLSENWLGLVGVTSLMAAWMFLTMWLWDKGQSYRIGMGAVPLLGLTLGTAWLAQFIARLPDAAPRAVSLFSALALLSVPFNFALGATLLGIESGVARTAGGVLALVYIAATPWVSARIAIAFGHDTRRFLLESNVVGYVPALVVLVAGTRWLEASLAALLFITLAALARGLSRAQRTPETFGLSWLLFAGVCLLVNAIPHVFFRVVPSADILSLAAQAMALMIAMFGQQRPLALLVAALVSATGVLAALVNPAWLPLTCIAASGFWFVQSRTIRSAWVSEVLAVHILGTALAIAWWSGIPDYAAAFVLAALLLLTRLEKRSAVEVMHYALPLTLVGAFALGALATSNTVIAVNALVVLASAVWGHLRFSTAYRNALYFANLGLTALSGYAALSVRALTTSGFESADIAASVESATLYITVLALVWALASGWLRDPLTRLHRTLVTWALCALAAPLVIVAAQWTGVLNSSFTQAALAATLIALVLAAARSRSVVPTYVCLAVAAVAGITLKNEMGLGSSGLGAALSAIAALLLAAALKRWRALEHWPSTPDQLFGRPFPLAGSFPFSTPLEMAALAAALIASIQATRLFDHAIAESKSGLALLLAMVVLGRLAYLRQFAWVGYASVGVALVLMAGVTVTMDLVHWPHAILGWLTLAVLLSIRLARAPERVQLSVARPLRHVTVVATWLSVPAALLAYGALLFLGATPQVLGTWFIAALLFVTVFIVPRRPRWWVHLAFVHGLAGLALALLYFSDKQSFELTTTYLVASAFLLLLLIAIVFETASSTIKQAYVRGAWGWLAVLALAALGLELGLAIDNASTIQARTTAMPPANTILVPLLCWLALELVCRRWRHLLFTVAKAVALIWLANMVLLGSAFVWPEAGRTGHLQATLAGLALFIVFESVWQRLAGLLGERLRKVPFANNDPLNEQHQLIGIIYFGIVALLLLHMVLVATHTPDEVIEHYWLYGAAGLSVWLYLKFGLQLGLYTGTGLFVYTNCFMAVAFLPQVPIEDVGVLHALAAACIVSLGCFVALSTWMRGRAAV